MFYSTRHFIRIVIILVIITLILPHILEKMPLIKSIIYFVQQNLNKLLTSVNLFIK